MRRVKFLALALVFILCQSCSKANKAEEAPKQNPGQETQLDANGNELAVELYEIKVGDQLDSKLSSISVKTSDSKARSLKKLVEGKESLLVLLKPGCIFCESMMAVMNTSKPRIKPRMVIALDGAHASFEEFQEKRAKYSNVKATWVYDFDNKLHDELGMNSFPRIVHLDKKQKVLFNQIGLVLPEDRSSLEGQPFPIILEKLSKNTVEWLKNL